MEMEFVQLLVVGIKQYWFECELILLCFHSYIGDCSAESCPLFRVLRHRTPSSPMYLSEVIRFSLRLIASIPLIQRREKCPSHEEKHLHVVVFFYLCT